MSQPTAFAPLRPILVLLLVLFVLSPRWATASPEPQGEPRTGAGDKSKDDDGFIVSWHWIFGDGATSTERNPVHTYAARGDYDVILTVTDNLGEAKTKTRRAEPK